MLARLRSDDTLVITRLDRLGRSVLPLITLGADLRERGIGRKVLEQGIDTATAEGRAMFGMLSVLAELQRELIVANARDGLAAARARGRTGGCPSKLSGDQIALAQQLYDGGEKTVALIAAMLNVPRTTVYGHLNTRTAEAATSPTVAAVVTAWELWRCEHRGYARAAGTSRVPERKPPINARTWPRSGCTRIRAIRGRSSPGHIATTANPHLRLSTSRARCAAMARSSPAISRRPHSAELFRIRCSSGSLRADGRWRRTYGVRITHEAGSGTKSLSAKHHNVR